MTNYEFKLDVTMPYDQNTLLELIRRKATINGGTLIIITELKANGYPIGTYESWDWVAAIKMGEPDDYVQMKFHKVRYKTYECFIQLPADTK